MRTPVKFVCLIACFTVMLMFATLSAGSDKKHTCPHDKTKTCSAAKTAGCGSTAEKKAETKDIEVKTAATSHEIKHDHAHDHDGEEECTHGLKTNCIETFHSAMSTSCHEYIPAGEFDKVRADIPAMLTSAKEIAEYSPGCTYGKSINEKFSAKKAEFLKSVEKLEKVYKDGSDKEVKQAFDEMHMNFAQMNGTLIMRPDGVEEFHDILATVWHEYLPKKNFDRVKEAAPELATRAQYLTSVQLNEKLADSQSKFSQAAEYVHKCARELEEACAKDDPELIAKKAESLHESYHKLTATF